MQRDIKKDTKSQWKKRCKETKDKDNNILYSKEQKKMQKDKISISFLPVVLYV